YQDASVSLTDSLERLGENELYRNDPLRYGSARHLVAIVMVESKVHLFALTPHETDLRKFKVEPLWGVSGENAIDVSTLAGRLRLVGLAYRVRRFLLALTLAHAPTAMLSMEEAEDKNIMLDDAGRFVLKRVFDEAKLGAI